MSSGDIFVHIFIELKLHPGAQLHCTRTSSSSSSDFVEQVHKGIVMLYCKEMSNNADATERVMLDICPWVSFNRSFG